MADSVALPVEIKYGTVPSVSPKYKYLKVPLNNIPSGSTGILLGANTAQLEFMLTPNVYNLAESYIGYTATTGQASTSNYSFLHTGTETLAETITFSDAAGNNLLNLQSANKYVKVMRKAATKLQDYMTHTLLDPLAPSQKAITTNLNPIPSATNGMTGFTQYYPGATSGAAYYGSYTNYTEERHMIISSGTGASSVITNNFKVPLNAFVHTILAEDKDLYFGQNMYLRMQTSSCDRMCWQADANDGTGTNATHNTGITLSNIYLYLAIEQDTVIRASVMDKFNKGEFRIPIQVIYPYRVAGSGASQNVIWALTKDMGRKLKWITHTVWDAQGVAADTLQNAYNSNNFNGLKISKYQTFLNGQPLQNEQLQCIQPTGTGLTAPSVGLDDYFTNLKVIEGSVLQNAAQYQNNWFHRDNFCRVDVPDEISAENLDDGLDMGEFQQQLQWSLQASTTSAAYIHLTFACFLRHIAIHPVNGIQWLD